MLVGRDWSIKNARNALESPTSANGRSASVRVKSFVDEKIYFYKLWSRTDNIYLKNETLREFFKQIGNLRENIFLSFF